MLNDRILNLNLETWPTVKIAGAIVLAITILRYIDYDKKVAVPVVGPGVRFTKWLAAIRNVWSARDSVHEGYAKHSKHAFQIPTMTRMDVFLCDRAMTREYYNLSEEHMSFKAVMEEELQFRWLLSRWAVRQIPNSVIAKGLSWQRTRSSNPQDPWYRDFSTEFVYGFQEGIRPFLGEPKSSFLPFFSHAADSTPDGSGWIAVPCFPLALNVIARLTTKSLFGEPLCRDPKFLDLCCRFGDAIPRDAMILRCFPSFMRPLLSKFVEAPRQVGALQQRIYDEIMSRRDSRDKNPMQDLLDFTMKWVDEHRADGWDDWNATDLMINTIFGGLHTSSQLVTHSIYELATRPEYVGPLREEVLECFATHGEGTKAALDAMHKVDSFIKETQRWNPLDASALARLVMKPYTFSNGLHVPKGSVIFTPNSPLFQDERFYKDAREFDGLRFARMRSNPELASQCSLTATSEHSMHFGMGRYACPGRFMASDETKLVLVHLLLNFDFAIENFGPRPKNSVFGKFLLPDMKAKILLRKRRVATPS